MVLGYPGGLHGDSYWLARLTDDAGRGRSSPGLNSGMHRYNIVTVAIVAVL